MSKDYVGLLGVGGGGVKETLKMEYVIVNVPLQQVFNFTKFGKVENLLSCSAMLVLGVMVVLSGSSLVRLSKLFM